MMPAFDPTEVKYPAKIAANYKNGVASTRPRSCERGEPLRQHFEDNFIFHPRAQHRVNRRQRPVEAHIHDAATHRGDRAGICWSGFVFHDSPPKQAMIASITRFDSFGSLTRMDTDRKSVV